MPRTASRKRELGRLLAVGFIGTIFGPISSPQSNGGTPERASQRFTTWPKFQAFSRRRGRSLDTWYTATESDGTSFRVARTAYGGMRRRKGTVILGDFQRTSSRGFFREGVGWLSEFFWKMARS